MKKLYFVLVGIATAFVTIAFAEMPTPSGSPKLEFHTIPVEGTPKAEHKVTPYRLYDKMVVTV